MTDKTTDAIVRGPMPYFGKDGVLYMPGQIVRDVPAGDVSDKGAVEKEAMVSLQQPVVNANGELVTEAKKKISVQAPFMPLKKDSSVIAEPVDTATVATGNPDRLNVTDFLKQSDEQIVAAIASGSVDSHLGVIEQAVVTGKGGARKSVKDAITARLAATTR